MISHPSNAGSMACESHFACGAAASGFTAEHDFIIGADGIRSRVRSQLLGVHEPVYRWVYTVWRGLARLKGSVPTGTDETWGRESVSAFSTPAATDSPGNATANTDSRHIRFTRKAAGVNFCGCSPVGTKAGQV